MKKQLYSLHLKWKQWTCRSYCQYLCMMQREMEREALGLKPVKYHGKWPSKYVSVFQVGHSFNLSTEVHLSIFTIILMFFLLLSFRVHFHAYLLHSSQIYFYPGACFCCPLNIDSCCSVLWLAILFPISILQVGT